MSVPLPSAGPRRASRALAGAVASVVLVAGGLLAIAPTASAVDDDASISGTLTGGGLALEDDISLLRVTAAGASYVDDTATDEGGYFEFTGLAAGTYTLQMEGEGSYLGQFLGGTAASVGATTIVVGAGQARTGVNFEASAGTTVVGKISATGIGAVEDADVELRVRDIVGGAPVWYDLAEVSTDETGYYTFPNVPKGTFTTLAFYSPTHSPAFYGNVAPANLLAMTPPTNARTFAVGSTAVAGIDITLQRGGIVEGTVTRGDGKPMVGSVLAMYVATDAWGYNLTYPLGGSNTLDDGSYAAENLPHGTYTLAFMGLDVAPQALGGNAVDRSGGELTAFGMGWADKFEVGPSITKLDARLRTFPYVSPSTTKVALSKTSRAYGAASTATVSIAGKIAGLSAAGSVTLTDGAKVIGTRPVAGGKATFVLPANLAVGKHSLKATFVSTGVLRPSAPAVVSFTVTKVGSKTTAAPVSSPTKAKKAALEVTVVAKGAKATGEVTVKKGKKTVGTGTLKKGKATVKLSKLKSGKHKLTVIYTGSSTVAASKSGKVKIKIK